MNKLSSLADVVASDFIRNSANPTESLTKIAQENNLNAQEIERIANRANRKIAVELTKRAARGDSDPHFTFPVIKTADVIFALKPKEKALSPKPPSVATSDGISRVFEFEPSYNRDLRCTINDDPVLLADNVRSIDPPSKEIAIQALNILKSRARIAQAKLRQSEIRIENLISNIEKRASHELLSGTPIEVMMSLPETCHEHIEKVANKLREWGHQINRSDDEYEINGAHPLVKMAQDIAFYEMDAHEARMSLAEIEGDIRHLRRKM